ncbi:unnamed protein product [Rhizophagus irregularis]|nr:unnamed protein product [Rhizophagus irregularis]CAB4428547.1 unnamed protein product [Rhizophagus irregularis]
MFLFVPEIATYNDNFRGIPPRVVQADCRSFQMRLHIISILSCTFNCNKSVRVLLHGGYHIMVESSDELVSSEENIVVLSSYIIEYDENIPEIFFGSTKRIVSDPL